jgi:hypothetical protein
VEAADGFLGHLLNGPPCCPGGGLTRKGVEKLRPLLQTDPQIRNLIE